VGGQENSLFANFACGRICAVCKCAVLCGGCLLIAFYSGFVRGVRFFFACAQLVYKHTLTIFKLAQILSSISHPVFYHYSNIEKLLDKIKRFGEKCKKSGKYAFAVFWIGSHVLLLPKTLYSYLRNIVCM
jgi:hypothetical protein